MKIKTRKSLAKRVKLTGVKANRWGKKASLVRKAAGQSHFNAREASKTTTKKRRRQTVPQTDHKNILRQLPYA
jgi:ribosomal protein L35